ncbi:MAG: hypothetical protein P1U47_05255 [Zhongshania sp.]|uniref:hypothetical protein n=1 Tax=Zhongshania sp. TaxID=1971902 RepID=UPI00260D3B8B|nr:hypothetical protein [Zhongshania sp.]MDF1691755.1 hypothetical protein [Zhongshania sp.]
MLRVFGGWLFKLLGNGTALAVLLALGGVIYHGWRTGNLQSLVADRDERLNEATAELERWRSLALAYRVRGDKLAALQRSANDAVRQLQLDLDERNKTFQATALQIRQAPPEDDGPVAAVLRQTLESLP